MATTPTLSLGTAKLADFSVTTTTKKSEKHITIYSNAVHLGVSPWDIRIAFGQVIEGGAGSALVETEATVIMSPGHAKAMAKTLNNTIKEFETLFGVINDPMEAINAAAVKAAPSASTPKKITKK